MTDERQRPPQVSAAEHLLVAALGLLLFAGTANGQTFALQPGNDAALKPLGMRGSTRITAAELRKVDGLTIRGRLGWPLSFWESNVAACRKLGKPYTLLVMGGDARDPTTHAHQQKVWVAITQLASKYRDDPLCWGVHVTGCSRQGHSEELFWGRPMPAKSLATNKTLIERWAKEFSRQRILLAGSANDPAAMRTLIKHGVAIAPGRFIYKINSLSAKTPVTGWVGADLIVDAAKLGAGIGWEMLDNSSAARFGGTFAQSMAKLAALEKRAGVKTSYLAIYRGDLAKAGAK